MLNYTKTETIRRPRLVISHDEDPESPRQWSNLGYFITVDSRYNSPDKHEAIERIVKETGDKAFSQEDHIELIKDEIEETQGEKVIAIYPVVKYEHSGVSYKLGTAHGFDYSNNGFYIITEATQKEVGVKKKDFEKHIASELETYNSYANGEVYRFELFDENGEDELSVCGFYDIEDIRDHLPKEFEKEDLDEYMKW